MTIIQDLEESIEILVAYRAFLIGKPGELTLDGQKKIIEAKIPKKLVFTPPKSFEAANEAEKIFEKMKEFIDARCELDLKGSVRGSILRDEFNRFSGLNLNNTRAFPILMSRVMTDPIPYGDGSIRFITKTLDRGGSPIYRGLRLKSIIPTPPMLPPFPTPTLLPLSPTHHLKARPGHTGTPGGHTGTPGGHTGTPGSHTGTPGGHTGTPGSHIGTLPTWSPD